MLWQTRWRLAGHRGDRRRAALAPTLRAPDILIGRDAELVAVRGADGELSAVGATRASFELERWLEHDGARRCSRGSGKGRGLRLRRHRLPRHGEGHDGRRRAASGRLRRGLPARAQSSSRGSSARAAAPRPKTVVDFFAARRQGTHALYIEADGSIRIETVAAARGVRPWSMPAPAAATGRRTTPAAPPDLQ